MKLFILFTILFFLLGCGSGGDATSENSSSTVSTNPPSNDATWYLQRSGTIDSSVETDVYGVDLFTITNDTIATLHDANDSVVCMMSAGVLEANSSDSAAFDPKDLGELYSGSSDAYWLDIRSSRVRNLMEQRVVLGAQKGCDGIAVANVDAYMQKSGFSITADDQLEYNRFLAQRAHDNGLYIILMNDFEQMADLQEDFDGAISEGCVSLGVCAKLDPFIEAKKAVLDIEYDASYFDEQNSSALCAYTEELSIKTLLLPRSLDGSFFYSCDDYPFTNIEYPQEQTLPTDSTEEVPVESEVAVVTDTQQTVVVETVPLTWQKPQLGSSWYYQLTGELNSSIDADIYDIDLFETSSETIADLHDANRSVLCYLSAGSFEPYREDSDAFNTADLGNTLDGWPDERWLDIRSANVQSIIAKRIALAREKGCDGVETDNVDGYTNDTGFDLTYADQLAYNRFLAQTAHENGLYIALKNDFDQVADLETDFDLVVSEQCLYFNECQKLEPFSSADKPVLNVEYNSAYYEEHNMTILCNNSNSLDLQTLLLDRDLNGSLYYSCNDYLFDQKGVGFGGSNAFKFHDTVWVNSADLVFGTLDSDYYKSITDYNLSAFLQLSGSLQKSHYVVFWITQGWQESWFSLDKIQGLIDAGYIPVFNYWYFGDALMNGLDSDLSAYYADAKRLKDLLSQLHGTKIVIMEPEFNKENILADPQPFIEAMRGAMDILDDKEILLSLCMTDTGSRSEDETYEKCGYANCALGDLYEWSRPETIYNALLDKIDFISFQEMVAQFSRDPADPGTWDDPNPIAYSDAAIGIDLLATRIDNLAAFLHQKYNKAVFLPYIAIATATWSDANGDNIIDSDELNTTGWEEKASVVYASLPMNNLFGFAVMELFDNPQHDLGGYQFFLENEYHLGIVKAPIVDLQLTGAIEEKANIVESVFNSVR